MSTGHLVYALRDGTVWAVPFDSGALSVDGSPTVLLEGVMVKSLGIANFSISTTGSLLYAPSDAVALVSRLVTVGRDGLSWGRL